MELRHLRYFVRVAEELHFARAAARLGISQPPLSQQIRLLEEELGVRLFERSSRRVVLTSAGHSFLVEARATLAQAERAVRVAQRAARGEVGELTVGFNASAPFVPIIAKAIHAFTQAYPEVRLNLSELPRPQQIAALTDGTIDIGFMRGARAPEVPESIAARALMQESLFVAMRPDHRLAARKTVRFADLEGEPMLFYARALSGGFTGDLTRLLREAGVEPLVAQEVREVSTLFGLAAAGVGITVFAESLCALQASTLEYRRLTDASASTTMWLLDPRERATPPCRRFLEMIDPDAPAVA